MAIRKSLPLGMRNQDSRSFVNAIYPSRHRSAIDEELDRVTGAKAVISCGNFAMGQQSMLGGAVSEQPLRHVFKTGLGTA